MLLELKEKAIAADKAYSQIEDRFCEWERIVDCSDNLTKFLDLDLGEENKTFINNLNNVATTLKQAYIEAEAKRDNLVLKYALAKLGGNLGDIIDYLDFQKRKRAIVIEDAQLWGEGITVMGSRLLKTGKVGVRGDYICLDTFSWKLRESN